MPRCAAAAAARLVAARRPAVSTTVSTVSSRTTDTVPGFTFLPPPRRDGGAFTQITTNTDAGVWMCLCWILEKVINQELSLEI